MTATTPVCPPLATKGAASAVAAPAAPALGAGTRQSKSRSFLACFLFLLLCHITSPASASPEMMTATTVSTAPTTCSIDFPIYWFIALWIGCALIALEIFHWAFQPLLRWIVRRFA